MPNNPHPPQQQHNPFSMLRSAAAPPPLSHDSSRLPDEHSLRSHRPASSELGESAAIAEAAAAAASAAAVMKTYDHASPQPGEKPVRSASPSLL